MGGGVRVGLHQPMRTDSQENSVPTLRDIVESNAEDCLCAVDFQKDNSESTAKSPGDAWTGVVMQGMDTKRWAHLVLCGCPWVSVGFLECALLVLFPDQPPSRPPSKRCCSPTFTAQRSCVLLLPISNDQKN